MPITPVALFLLSGLGVNIHTTAPAPGETALIRSAGFRTVRMDLHWHDTETRPGHYDWTPYDRLLAALREQEIRPLLILNYGHPAYDNGLAPATPHARAAFARWAAAAAARYKGQGILWEIYNEPNLAHFWKPQPDAAAYTALALETAAAIRAAAPGETIIGPAASGVDLAFLEQCFRLGLLAALDAVTVHPYRHHEPESVLEEYLGLRSLIARHSQGREIPILCGEWGYSAAWSGFDEHKQALMLTRVFLTNTAAGIPLTIWYDWRNDGPSASDPEHNFGVLAHGGAPKLAFRAAAALAAALEGFEFRMRLETGRAGEFVLLFQSGPELKLAAWTTAPQGRRATLPVSAGGFLRTDWLGEEQQILQAGDGGLDLTLTPEPQFLSSLGENANLRKAADWDALPPFVRLRAPAAAVLATNLASRPLTVLRNQSGPQPLSLPLGGGRSWTQSAWIEVENPLTLVITPQAAIVGNPHGEPLQARLAAGRHETPVSFDPGETSAAVALPEAVFQASATLTAADGQILAAVPETAFAPAGDPALSALVLDGDAAIPAEASLRAQCPAAAPAGSCASISLRTGAGPRFLRVSPNPRETAIPDQARAAGLWVYGDASGVFLRLRFADATGQVFQPAGVSVNWRGWRWVEIPIRGDQARPAFWGGPADGEPRGRLTLDTLLLLDKPGPEPFSAEIAVSAIHWISRAD